MTRRAHWIYHLICYHLSGLAVVTVISHTPRNIRWAVGYGKQRGITREIQECLLDAGSPPGMDVSPVINTMPLPSGTSTVPLMGDKGKKIKKTKKTKKTTSVKSQSGIGSWDRLQMGQATATSTGNISTSKCHFSLGPWKSARTQRL
ncbi:hypothetical protein FIBSPDRAFT_901678 [Athelia psychrophila]|uniref:Uncharacterized protein n=1 Tax=Athelia psychrophila TaxID=1759441 RepID=A0A165WU30_9AGAM|nr:hypothetical protein FIBSPDRAFT_901678 [Fibularhizoctonia sp. CBS 109695]